MSSKTKYPSKAVQVTCYYCEKTILKQNFKAHTETVHTGKPVREKVIGAAFDLFQLARKRNIVDEVEDEPANKQSRQTETNENEGDVDALNNSIELEGSDLEVNANTRQEMVEISELISNNHKQVMHKLDGIAETLDDVIKDGKEKNAGELLAENDLIIEKTRSVLEFCSLYPEFQYIKARNIVKCTLCSQESEHDISEPYTAEALGNVPGIFLYEGSESFASNALLTRDFRNLKIALRRHLSRNIHKNKLIEQMKEAEEFLKSDSKNKEAALRCARICLMLYKKGRPFSDYSDLVAINIQGGTFMGNINHSKRFASAFLSSVALVVRRKVYSFFSTPMKQTGFQPPVKIIADKDTTKHRYFNIYNNVSLNDISYYFSGPDS